MHHISHEYIQNNPQLPFKLFSFHAHNLARVIPLHWHQSTEILYCESGELQVTVKNQSYLLKKNDFIVINPYEIHTSKSPIENHILCIQLPFSFLSYVTSNSFYNQFTFSANSTKQKQDSDAELIKNMSQTLTLGETFQSKGIVKNLMILTNVTRIIRLLVQFYAQDNVNSYSNNRISFITKTLSYLEKSYTSDLTLNDIAQHFSYSTYYTSRLINENLGVSFSNLLRIIRINKSIELVRSTSLPLEKIAAKTGFKTYRNLYNSFYKIYDMSPIQFKNK